MSNSHIILSQKQIDYINTRKNFSLEILEGTTYAGKTFIACVKAGIAISESKYKAHIISARTKGKAETIKDEFMSIYSDAKYYGYGDKNIQLAHIKFEDKIIYVVGYENSASWQFIRGMNNIGVSLIDEFNLAHPDFYKELVIRSNDFCIGTLNPDDPDSRCYSEYINRCRPYSKYAGDVPDAIMNELNAVVPEPSYRYWFFSFKDNPVATDELVEKKVKNAVPGSKQYKNLILGLREKASGLVFPQFSADNLIDKKELLKKIKSGEINIVQISCGVDTSYSAQSEDTTAFTYILIDSNRKIYVVDEYTFNNRDLNKPLAPSDMVVKLMEFLDRNGKEWGYCRNVFVDSADSASFEELQKYTSNNPTYYIFNKSYKIEIMDRIRMMHSWIYNKEYLVCNHCEEHIKELNRWSWDEKKINTPEDRHNHTIDSVAYAWIPYRFEIGNYTETGGNT